MSEQKQRPNNSDPGSISRRSETPPDRGDIADDAEREEDAARPLPHDQENIGRSTPAR